MRLGAGRVLVIGLRTRRQSSAPQAGRRAEADQRIYSTPLFLFGKLLDALLLDRIENDLANLRQVNAAITELLRINPIVIGHEPLAAALEAAGGGLRPVSDLFIRPSQDLAALAAHVLARPAVRPPLSRPARSPLPPLGA